LKVILLREVPGLGHPGDIVNVSDGYARNFLMPQDLALPGTQRNLTQAKRRIVHLEKQETIQRAEAMEAAKHIGSLRVEIKAKVGEGTRLFGSVTHKDIQKALERAGFVVDRRKIELKEHIRSLGTYQVPVRLHQDLVGTFTLEIVPQ